METRAHDTRSILLEAAFREIYHHGYQGASLARVLADTGLTKGALYHHFSSKHALGLAVIDEIIGPRLEQEIIRPLRESPDPAETLLAVLRLRAAKRDGEAVLLGCPLNNLIQEMSPVDAEFRDHLARILSAWEGALINGLQRSQNIGRLRGDVNCKTAGLFVLAAWEGCFGIAKNQQSATTFRHCMTQLAHYVANLAVPATTLTAP